MVEPDNLWRADRGASPVVGVILIIGVCIIVAAVLGGALYQIGGSVSEEAPQVQFESEQVDGVTLHANGDRYGEFSYVEFEHISGDTINYTDIKVVVNGQQAYDVYKYGTTGKPTGAIDDCNTAPCHYTTKPNGSVSTGDTIRVVIKNGEIGREGRSFTIDGTKGNIGEGEFIYNGGPGNKISLQDGDEVQILFKSGDSTVPLADHTVEEPSNIWIGG